MDSLAVIIPVYNGLPFLKEAVESILGQSYSEFQLLIADDGSSDGSMDYVSSLSDSRIRIFREEHHGLCELLNQACKTVTTDLVARLDQDDIALPFRLEKQTEFLRSHPAYVGVLAQITRIGVSGREFGSYRFSSEQATFDYDPFRDGCIANSAFCFKRNKFLELGGYRAAFYPADDFDLLFRMSERGKIGVINEPLVKYRIHREAATFDRFYEMQKKSRCVIQNAQRRRNGLEEVPLEEFEENLVLPSRFMNARKSIAEHGMFLFRLAGMEFGEGNYLSGLLCLCESIFLNPRFAIGRLLSLRKSKSRFAK